MDCSLQLRRFPRRKLPVELSDKKKFIKIREAYNQSQQRLELGRETPLIVPLMGHDQRVELVIRPDTQHIFEGNKLKFVVSIEASDTAETSSVSIYEKPLCYDDKQCNYYLLKCTLRQNNTPRNRILIWLMYVLGECCCLQASDPRLTNLFMSTLHTITPSWNKFNSLLLHASQDDHGYFTQSTTAYQTSSYPPPTQDLQQFQPVKPLKSPNHHNNNTQSTQSTRNPKPESTSQKFCCSYFSKVVKIIEPFASLFRAASRCKEYLMRGFSYDEQMLRGVLQLVNQADRVDMNRVQEMLIKGNMSKAVEMCKRSYTELVRMLFLEGKSLELHRLSTALGEVYEQVINSYDSQFQGLHHFEQFEIYRSILKRYIEQKQNEVHQLNEFMHENECLDGLQGSVDRKLLSLFFNKKIEGTPQSNTSLNLSALKTFLLEFYTQGMQQDIERMKQRNQKLVMHTLNYSQNPVEMLKNYQQRVQFCRQKKKRLQDCLQLAERQYDTCDNLYHGFQLQLAQQRDTLARLGQRAVTQTVMSP